MLQFKWIAFQAVIALLTFVWIGTWADITKYGIAPALVSFGVALLSTALLSAFLDWLRARRLRVSDEAERRDLGLIGADRAFGDRPQQIPGSRVRENIRKLP